MAQRLALDVGHRVKQQTTRDTRVEQGQDVGVREAGGDLDLAQEAFGSERLGELGPEHLEGYPALIAVVDRQVDDRHAAAAELALERVATAEAIREAGVEVVHRV